MREVEAIREAASPVASEAATSGLRFSLTAASAHWLFLGHIQDTQWIEEAALAGDVLLGKDLAIARNPLEAQVIYMASARVFALSNAALSGPVMAQWYLANEAKIIETAMRAHGPYVMAVNLRSGLRRTRLAFPPG